MILKKDVLPQNNFWRIRCAFVRSIIMVLSSTDSQASSPALSQSPSGTGIPSTRRNDSDPRGEDVSGARWNGATGWSVYFPGTVESDADCKGRAEVISKVKRAFMTDQRFRALLTLPPNASAFPLDFSLLSQPPSPPALRSIVTALRTNPDIVLASLGLAACRAAEDLLDDVVAEVSHATKLTARIRNFRPLTPLRYLKGASVGTFVAVRGTVVRVSTIRQQLISLQFRCGRCGEDQTVSFPDYCYSYPKGCPTEKCRSRNFVVVRASAATTDWQRIRIQEIQQRDHGDGAGDGMEEGRIPRTIDAELFADLIDGCVPGDIATVCGILKVMQLKDGGGGQHGQSRGLYYMYIEANSISTTRSRAGVSTDTSTPAAATVHSVIHEIVCENDPFGFLVHSAVPSIYGHELVKSGLLLALFGGAHKSYKPLVSGGGRNGLIDRPGENEDNDTHDSQSGNTMSSVADQISIRCNAHVLIVGDPGLGKSQMLKAFCNIAPRGVYVCGTTSSTTGLTVTVVREPNGDFALEAGALVLGDGGVCCIDEFDKMSAEHGALLEAMEQQSVSVAKAGLVCNLSARTTVLAAANPVGGNYDRAKTVCENLKLARPLLSRFDLVFILMDRANAQRDRFISEHVMRTFGRRARSNQRGSRGLVRGRRHGCESYPSQSYVPDTAAAIWRGETRAGLETSSGGVNGGAAAAAAAATTQAQAVAIAKDGEIEFHSGLLGALSGANREHSGDSNADDDEDSGNTLEQRLQAMIVKDPLPPSLFREYVLYARTHVHPSLSLAAKRVLQKFYVELRKSAKSQAANTTPITTRQLESMIRLAEARARSVMRTVVTASDARDVIEIMRKCMIVELTDDSGTLDFGRSSGMSRAGEAKRFFTALDAEARRKNCGVFSDADLKRVANAIGVEPGLRFSALVESVNNQGIIIKKGGGKWELSSYG